MTRSLEIQGISKRYLLGRAQHAAVVSLAGGTAAVLARGEGQIRHLVWASSGALVAEDTGAANRWWRYEVDKPRAGVDKPEGLSPRAAGERAPLWPTLTELTAGQIPTTPRPATANHRPLAGLGVYP